MEVQPSPSLGVVLAPSATGSGTLPAPSVQPRDELDGEDEDVGSVLAVERSIIWFTTVEEYCRLDWSRIGLSRAEQGRVEQSSV